MIKRVAVTRFIISLSVILSLTLSAGCEIISGTNTTLPSQQPQTTVEQPRATSNNITPINPTWSIAPAATQASMLPSIADVVAMVKPSVVAINTEVVTLDFFNRPLTQKGAGSGWIIDKSGIIVTNNHVVEGAKTITVILDDGRSFTVDMKTVATDSLADLAVLRIAGENLTAVRVGDSHRLRIGDWVVAIGNSLGQGIRATQGIVSRQGVSLPVDQGQTLFGLIETDAAVNPGNSGGPLVNMSGEVIGITSAKISATGVEGMGYAIGSQEVIPIIQQLINTGYVVRPWLGVSLYTVDQFAVQRYDLAVDKGVLVVNVSSGSPADKAGIKTGDVITKFGDKDIAEVNELIRAIQSAKIGQKVAITFWRGKTESTAEAALIESPPPS
ncbi:MAG: trypsin-like peptidase domain-containing protein [Chloroflexi bacterium]|nr:trypsin-like peptidase domain-containing protein [Chloroflexota bacterium]